MTGAPGGYSEHVRHWTLDRSIDFLNHGSFGACPVPVLDAQAAVRAELERQPVRFFMRELEPRLDAVRAALGALVRADPDDLALVPNASTGVNTVLRSLRFEPGDELLLCDHEYNASRNALVSAAERAGARPVVARVPFPLDAPERVVEAFAAAATPRTRLALVDHVTSQTGLVFPVAEVARALAGRGIDTLVDGAHAPGMLDLDLAALAAAGVAWYTGNCHKWLCTPKGSAFLWARRDRQAELVPLVVSHGLNARRAGRSRFRLLFDWTGTVDPSPWLVLPDAIRFLDGLLPGGLAALRRRNRELALEARRLLAAALGAAPPAPDAMIGSLAALPIPDAPPGAAGEASPLAGDPFQQALLDEERIEVPVMAWPEPPRRVLRVSCQAYNAAPQYARLADALRERLGRA